MKKLQFMALSMLLSTGYMTQAGAGMPGSMGYGKNSTKPRPMQNNVANGQQAMIRQQHDQAGDMNNDQENQELSRQRINNGPQNLSMQISDEVKNALGEPVTSASLANYITDSLLPAINNLSETPTDEEIQAAMKALMNVQFAMRSLIPMQQKTMMRQTLMPTNTEDASATATDSSANTTMQASASKKLSKIRNNVRRAHDTSSTTQS